MSRVDEFDSFLRSGFDGVLQVTYALCGDRNVAREATVEAFRRAWRDWSKIRDRNPIAHVRSEAWRATGLSRGTHPLRRRHEEDSDVDLLQALGDLTVDQRRLLVLMTLGNTDLEEACREVGLPAEDGIEQATDALAQLEKATRQTIGELETRLQELSAATASFEAPAPASLRKAARRGTQRNAVLLVAAVVLSVIGAGVVSTSDDALARQQALPDREKIGAETNDIVLDARKIDDDDLLQAQQVEPLDTTAEWTVDGTDEDPANTTPYATCPTQRFADPDPLRVLVRTFSSTVGDGRVAQSIEVSRSEAIAEKSSRTLVRWFADCAHQRTQLVAAYEAKRPIGDFTILRLISHRSPQRVFTVGFAYSGSVTSTLVHETDGTEGPEIEDFAQVLNDSVSKVCEDSGGRCTDDFEVVRADVPRTTEAPSFLGVVDLPPIADVDRVWASAPAEADPNPAATPCDQADYTGKTVEDASSRIYVLYQATDLPREFGLSETVARFSSDDDAKAFLGKVKSSVDACPDVNLSAEIDQEQTIKNGDTVGYVWRITVEVSDDVTAQYRLGIVRRGNMVAQVTMVPSGEYDVKKSVFKGLVTRAGTRLEYAE